MHTEEKLTAETFPANPEKATLEGKNKFIGFWLFLGGDGSVCVSLRNLYRAEGLHSRRAENERNV